MIERGIARDGYKVFSLDGKEIGYVTSGSPAPFVKKNIALAYVPPGLRAARVRRSPSRCAKPKSRQR